MPQHRKWTDAQLCTAVAKCTSARTVLLQLGLKPAGGNYTFIQKQIELLGYDTSHFKGKAWNKGLSMGSRHRLTLQSLLVEESDVQSYKLKHRLFAEGVKDSRCELCGWCEITPDGRIPVELDHINGNRYDNRIENLRILCPNCHSLQPTHRGKNIRKHARVV